MSSEARRRLLYYAIVTFGALAVHLDVFASLAGSAIADLFRRNSEAYVLMLLIPAYWDTFASPLTPRPRRGHSTPQPMRAASQLLWLAALLAAALVTEVPVLAEGLGLGDRIVTLGEGFVGALVISGYLAWSRGLVGVTWPPRDGGPVVGLGSRLAFYGAVLGLAVLAQQSFVTDQLGAGIVEALQLNIEAYAAMLTIPSFFDLVAGRGRTRLSIWSGVMVAVPIVSQPGVLDGTGLAPLAGWTVRATEAFVAALVIGLYFAWWRGTSERNG